MGSAERFDLVVLTADKDMRLSLEALLDRNKSLRIREIRAEVLSHPGHDPGCFREGPAFLSLYQRRAQHALLLFDRHGCGQEQRSREELENDVEERLARVGWAERCAAVVLDPELEAWIWSESPRVDETLGWKGKQPDLRSWLRETGLWEEAAVKPSDPKEAFERALVEMDVTRSSALFATLSEKVSFRRCQDPAFQKLKTVLQRWFPQR